MTILKAQNPYDGTIGANASSAPNGFASFIPIGTSTACVYAEVPGAGTCLLWTWEKCGEVFLPAGTAFCWRGWIRFAVAPPLAVAFSRFISSSAAVQAGIRLAPTRLLESRNPTTGSIVTGTYALSTNTWYQVIHEVDQAPDVGDPYQRVRLFSKPGELLDEITNTVGMVALHRHTEGPTDGTAGLAGWQMSTDNGTLAQDEILDEIVEVGPDAVLYRRVGAPVEDGFTVVIKVTPAVLAARIKIFDMAGSAVLITPNQTPPSTGYVKFQIGGLNSQTRYKWLPQIDQGEGFVSDVVECYGWTAPDLKRPASFKMALWGCHKGLQNEEGWADLLDDYNPHYGFDGGDRGYPNRSSTDPALHRFDWERIEDNVAGFTRQARVLPFDYILSDHDSDGGNGGWKTPGLAACKVAYREVFPHPVLAPLDDDCLAFVQTFGRFRFVVCDFRMLDGASDQADRMTISAGTTPIGIEQEEWLYEQLDKARTDLDVVHTFFVTDPPTTGPYGGVDKHDWWPAWPAAHARLMTELNKFDPKTLTVLEFDNHLLLADDGTNNPNGDWSIVGSAGFKQDSGNFRGGWPTGPQHFWGSPEGEAPISITAYMRMTCEDDGTTATITFEGRLAKTHESAFTMVLSHPVGGAKRQWWVAGENISTAAFNVRNRSAGWVIPPKRGENVPVAARNGRKFAGRKKFDEREFVLAMWAVGADPVTGIPPPDKYAEVLEHLDWLARKFCVTDEQIEIKRIDGSRRRRCLAEVVAGVDMMSMAGGTRAEFLVALRAAQPFWEDEEETSQTLSLVDSLSQDVVFTAFAGASAPHEHLALRIDGKLDDPKIVDNVSGEWLKIENSAVPSDYLLIDSNLGTVVKWDNGLATFLDKIMKTEQRTSGPLLSFMPKETGISVHLDAATTPGDHSTATLIGKRRYLIV